MGGLKSKKQILFVQEYLIDLNATQAAIRAGYKHPDIGRQLLTKTHVQEAIQKAMDARATRTEITQDLVLNEYAKIAFLDPRKFFDGRGHLIPIHELDDDTAASLAGMDVITKYTKDEDGNPEPELIKKIKIADKLKALQDVGKHLGFFKEDNEQRNPDTLNHNINSLTPEEMVKAYQDAVKS